MPYAATLFNPLAPYSPPGYAELTPAQKAEICNGCGAGGWKFDVVPDNLLGLPITEWCNRHDYGYATGKTEDDKALADLGLLHNLLWAINDHERKHRHLGEPTLASRRRVLAMEYYNAVHEFGHEPFWSGKVKPA